MHATAVHVLPGMLRYLGVAEDDVDDLSQEVLLGAYTSLPRYDPHYPAGARGVAFPPPSASSSLHDLVFAAVPISIAAAAAADPADPADPAYNPADPAYDPADPATPPLGSPPAPSSRSRPSSLSPRWRSESAWLFGIAWRKVRSHLERAYRRREVPVGLADAACFEGADAAPSSEQRIVRKERIALAIRLLASIAPERRAVLLMADAYEIPMHEVARALEINENTAASRLRLAREDYRAAVKRLRSEEQHALRSGLLMLPLFSLASASSAISASFAAPSRPVLAGASAIAEANAPATLPSPRSHPGRHEPTDRPRNPARSASFARVVHLARPLARFLRPVLARGTAAIVGAAVVVAALAPTPVSWANRLAPIATQLLVSRAVHAGARPETDPGEPPRSKAPPRDAIGVIPAEETSAARTPPPPPSLADGSGHLKPAAPRPHASSERRQDPLTEEILLLDAVRQALWQGDRTTAMERIAAHERRFPQGRLNLMRERLRSKMDPAQPAPAGNPTRPAPAGSAAREMLP
ncbi:RNA polymerase sigma factor [Sorangium sp. So ce296]|uniref:RNA polymerase sigma factor n=1 Tax=Sorangium sp. So ce296 TaxID=3133296 RepID=UPI003F5EB9A4